MIGGFDLIRKIWEKVQQIYQRVLTMTDAEALLQQARDLIQRQDAILNLTMQQIAAKNAEIATLRDELARAQLPDGVLLSHEQHRELVQCINNGNAKLTEFERVL